MTTTVNRLFWLLAAILLARLGLCAMLPFADTTEPRYAEIARIMAGSGDWITPWFREGVPFWGKPPLSFWSQALAFKLLGVSEFAGRLPSWLANLGVVALIYRAGLALHNRPRSNDARLSGLLAAIIYSTMALGFLSAGTVMTDSFLALATTLVITSLILRIQGGPAIWGWLFFIGLALGLLAKGPLVLVLSGLPVFIWVAATRNWPLLWRCLPWVPGTLLMLALSVPWYLLAELKTPGFIDYFIVGEHIKRFLVSNWQGDLYGNAHEFTRGTIWLYLALASFPWGPIMLASVFAWLWTKRADRPGTRTAQGLTILVLAAAFTPALFFTFSGNILWTYVLPGLPFLALAIEPLVTRWRFRGTQPTVLAAVLLIPLLGSLAGVWFAAHPEHLKTEKTLVTGVQDRFDVSPERLFYLGDLPFSARFYSQGQAHTLAPERLGHFLERQTGKGPALVAVDRDDAAARETIRRRGQPVDTDKRYILFRVPPAS